MLEREQPIDEVPVAGLGGHAAGGGVGMGEQSQVLEVGELVADRRRTPLELGAQRLATHGRAQLEVFLDEAAQHQFLTIAQHEA